MSLQTIEQNDSKYESDYMHIRMKFMSNEGRM